MDFRVALTGSPSGQVCRGRRFGSALVGPRRLRLTGEDSRGATIGEWAGLPVG